MSPKSMILGAALLATSLTTSARQEMSPLPPLVLPAGFHAEVFAEKVENARSMAIGPQGTVFVGSQYVGKVHAVWIRMGSQGRFVGDRQRSRSTQWRGDAVAPVRGDRESLTHFDDIENNSTNRPRRSRSR
jgi:glucose/arabinose dehydrogenase